MLILSDIIGNAVLLKEGEELAGKINSQMIGRICLNKQLPYLYVIRSLLGDQCNAYLEMGVLFGGSMALVMQHPHPTIHVGIDIFTYYGKPEDYLGQAVSKEIAEKNVRKFNRHQHPFHLFQGSTHDPEVISMACKIREKYQLIFIDGDHTVSGVIEDFMVASRIVDKSGVIMVDDYGFEGLGVKQGIDSLDLKMLGFSTIGRIHNLLILQKGVC